ncbi:MAG: TIGR02300 family protein, partial [Rhizobiaceae bacterium]
MAKADLGTKRTCPETGKKFYDLNKDPIVSPYTGIAYPLSAFEQVRREARIEEEESEDMETTVAVDTVEFVPMDDDADGDDKAE